MVDLHCHILPDADDGADSIGTALEMAAMAADCGIDTIVATPHCNTRNERKNYRSEQLDEQFLLLQEAIDYYHIPVRLLPGSEVLVRGDMEQLLARRQFYTLAGSRYLLTEFYFDAMPDDMDSELARIAAAGLIPVVAHPERYFAVNDKPELVHRWRRLGYVIQVNKGSLLGRFTPEAYDTAQLLLSEHSVDVIATDAHHYEVRTPDITELSFFLSERCSKDYVRLLLELNPQRIIENRSVLRYHEGS